MTECGPQTTRQGSGGPQCDGWCGPLRGRTCGYWNRARIFWGFCLGRLVAKKVLLAKSMLALHRWLGIPLPG